MQTSLESQWQLETDTRWRIIKTMLFILVGLALLLSALWFWVTQPLLSTPSVQETASVNPERLGLHVRMLAQEEFPRDEAHPQNLDRVARYLRAEFERASASVSDQPYQVNGKIYRNVIAWFGPETRERIIIGAHYDTAGPHPGADDNASGVAGLIELGYLLGRASLPMRVELVGFTLEEPAYFRTNKMGSAVHAAALKQQAVKVRAMLSLEMIGYFSDEPDSQKFPATFLRAFYPSRGNFIGVVGRLSEGLLVRRVKAAMREGSSLPVHSICAPRFVPGIDFSDQLSYWDAGYDAVMITDSAFYRNPTYHTEFDTAEKLDYKRMAMVIEGVYAAIKELSR